MSNYNFFLKEKYTKTFMMLTFFSPAQGNQGSVSLQALCVLSTSLLFPQYINQRDNRG